MHLPVRLVLLSLLLISLSGCRPWRFPEVPADYREYAYVANTEAGTVSVLDLVELRQAGSLHVGLSPIAIAANPQRNEVYAVNQGSNNVSVIDAERNIVSATVAVHTRPSAIVVDNEGLRGYVTNSGSNSISVLDLPQRKEVSTLQTGEQPGVMRLSPDGRTLAVANRSAGSISVFSVPTTTSPKSGLRATFPGCAGASDIAILPDSTKAFVACPGSDSVLVVSLAAAPGSWPAKQDPGALNDHLLTRLRVGKAPVQLALKPDGGEIFVANSGSNNISEIATGTNEVGGSYPIGNAPVFGLVTADSSTLWVANAGADSLSIYSIDDGRLTASVRIGAQPAALAFSADEHLLLAVDAKSGDIAVVRTRDRNGPTLFTMLPSGAKPTAIATKSFHLR